MRRLAIALFLLIAVFPALAGPKETPAQKHLVIRFAKYLEREGWNFSYIGTGGKAKDVFEINLPNATVEALYRFRKQCIDAGTTREEMKAAGYHSILIRTGVNSVTFPKGEAVIRLDQ